MSNHKVDLATTTNITTTYSGSWANKYVSIALLSGKTLDNGGVTILPNIDYKYVIQKGAFDSNFIKNASCDFTDTGQVDLTERVLTLEEFQINSEFCKKDFSQTWQAAEMGYSVLGQNLPSSFQEFIVSTFAAKVADKYEQVIWGGTNGNAGEFDGFVTLFAADADVIDVAGVGAIDKANVVSELQRVVAAVPDTIYDKDDLYVYINTDTLRFYISALGLIGAGSGIDNKGTLWYNGVPLTIDGVKIFHASGMPANNVIAAQASNLYYGCGVMSDQTEIKIIDMADITGSQNVRFIMRWKAGIQYGIGAEVVMLA
tara:strand:+ start:9499 stop:10443 length:945 start_codon:yes stop_codon:yes gene_type:complete